MTDSAIRKVLLSLAEERKDGRTFCPSEAARRLAPDWRPLMNPVREAAAALVEEGRLSCTQRGRTADPVKTRGPVRLAAVGD